MQLSRYLKIYSYEESPAHLLLFSTRKLAKLLLHKNTFQTMEEGTLPPSDEALLAKQGMLVSDREEEKQAVLSLMDTLNCKNPVLNLIVVLNLDCNFACVYCYEGEMKGKLYMSGETARQLVDFTKARFTRDKKSLLIDFYGGEPLLSLRLIKSISRELKSFTAERGASYTFTLVTNGALFKRQVAEDLAPLGLKSVKITLDGPAEVHNHYRPFKSGADSFDILIKNIKETCDLVKINIGGNFESITCEKFPILLDYLMKEGLTPEKIASVKFDPIMKRPEGDLSPADYRGGSMSINEPWLLKATVFLREEILKRGYNTPKVMPVLCAVENTGTFVVNFDGVIYKCPGFIGKEELAIGDLQKGVKDYSVSHKLGLWKNEECAGCAYLPLCFGGCRYMSFLREGNIEKVDCPKAFLDASLETFIKQDIKYRLKANS